MNSHLARETKREVPLIAHVIFRLDVGGFENGLVNLINQTPPGTCRHAIICVTHATEFRQRIEAHDVSIIELNKRPGKDPAVYWRFWRPIRNLKPDVIHTRNVNTIEFQPLALLAGAKKLRLERTSRQDLVWARWPLATWKCVARVCTNRPSAIGEPRQCVVL